MGDTAVLLKDGPWLHIICSQCSERLTVRLDDVVGEADQIARVDPHECTK